MNQIYQVAYSMREELQSGYTLGYHVFRCCGVAARSKKDSVLEEQHPVQR